MKTISTKIIYGDCKEILKSIDDNSIDLIITSPPYANPRKYLYGGIKSENYLEWILS